MAIVTTDNKNYAAIANKLREKLNGEDTYKPDEMPVAIDKVYEAGRLDLGAELERILSENYSSYKSYFNNKKFPFTYVPTDILKHTGSGTTFENMFYGCNALTEVPLFDTSNGTSFYYMFGSCTKLLKIPSFNTSNGTKFSYMFYTCNALTEVPLFDTSKGTEFQYMFNGCSKLPKIPSFNTSSGTNFSYMFYSCNALTKVSLLNTAKGTNFDYMFNSSNKLETIEGIDLSKAVNISGTFNCTALANITILGTIKKTGFNFSKCNNLTHESLMSIINALADYSAYTTTYKITFGATNLAKLTAEEKAIMDAKGWTYS